MAVGTDYLPVATGGSANVDSQANFSGSGYQQNGFQNGYALPFQSNKVWRQASMAIAMLGNFIANQLQIYVADDGNLTNLLANFILALKGLLAAIVAVPFSSTPVFNLALGNTFEITLTGNVTSSTAVSGYPGQKITVIIHQDSVGGHNFAWPVNLPGAAIGLSASQTSVQEFIVDGAYNTHPLTPMTLS